MITLSISPFRERPMRLISRSLLVAAAMTLPLAATVQGQSDSPYQSHLKARQGFMSIVSFNIATLGGMARGNIAYDAEAAQTAADNIAAIAGVDTSPFWPEGSDNGALGDRTRALPVIWENPEGFGEAWTGFRTAATGMAEVAGGGLAALRGGIGPLGNSCGNCHEDFRQSID